MKIISTVLLLMAIPTFVLAAGEPSKVGFPQPPARKKEAKATSSSLFSAQQPEAGKNPVEIKAAVESTFEQIESIPPEVTTPVVMSATDVNRIVCQDSIKDVAFSSEKGIKVKISGNDAYIKFSVLKRNDTLVYAKMRSELYVVCGGATYNLIAIPRADVPSRVIRLSSGAGKRIKTNSSSFSGLPFEKAIIRVVKEVYTDRIPESYLVTKVGKEVGDFREIFIRHLRNVDIEGEGLRVKEFEIYLRPGTPDFKLSESTFQRKAFAENPVAVSLEKLVLRQGEVVRAFVVEQRNEQMDRQVSSSYQPPSEESMSADGGDEEEIITGGNSDQTSGSTNKSQTTKNPVTQDAGKVEEDSE